MRIVNSKKGMYFTVLTILSLSIFLFFFIAPSYEYSSGTVSVIENRVLNVNNFVENAERDLKRGLYISSFRAVMAMEEFVVNNADFVPDAESLFLEAMKNGTVGGESTEIMQDSMLEDWSRSIMLEGGKLNLLVNITIYDIDLFETDAWTLGISANYSMSVVDTTGLASWNRSGVTETRLSILGFEDPLYVVNGLGRVTNAINSTPFDNNFTYKVGGVWNVSKLMQHITESMYAENENAPSFLMRFENDLGASPNGIESMVNLKELSDRGLDIDTESSIIDYHYWDSEGDGDYRINGTPSWVKIDSGHRERYNVTMLSYPIS